MLTKIGSDNLKLKGSKWVCLSTKVTFLGHNLRKEGILPDSENVAKILNWPALKTVHDMRGILELRRYYCCLILHFSDRMRLLAALTKKDKPFY